MATHTGRSAQWSPSELGDLQSSLSITITPSDKEGSRKVAVPALIARDTPERKTLGFDADAEDMTSDEDTRDLAQHITFLNKQLQSIKRRPRKRKPDRRPVPPQYLSAVA